MDDPIETVWDDPDPLKKVSLPDLFTDGSHYGRGYLDDSFHRVGAAFQ